MLLRRRAKAGCGDDNGLHGGCCNCVYDFRCSSKCQEQFASPLCLFYDIEDLPHDIAFQMSGCLILVLPSDVFLATYSSVRSSVLRLHMVMMRIAEFACLSTPQSMAKDASDRNHQLGRRLGTDALELNQQPGRRLATRLSTVFGSIRVPCNIRSRTCPSRLYSRRSRA